ncbi:ABC transporter permease [Monashia sp. NPDC004114]
MNGFTGTGALLRLAARRDRVLIPVSILVLVVFVAGSAQATVALYPDTGSALGAIGDIFKNPALVAMYGPLTSMTLDAFAVFKTILLGAVFLCLLAYIVVRRHTRTEEEEGRLELVGSGVVGRRAPLAAAVLLGTIAVLVTALLITISAIGVGLDHTGSVALGVAWLTIGLTWVGVTAFAAQLTETARGTATFSLGALGVAFLLRAVGDTAADDSPVRFLTWISPLGWGEKVSPYGENRLWPLLLGVAAYAALTATAFYLLERRDLGAGIIPPRPGPARGRMSTVEGLTARLARGTVIGWVVLSVLLGSVVGSIAGNVQSLMDSPQTAELLRKLGSGVGSLVDTFFTAELHIAAIAVAAMGISLVTRMRSEETSMRAESVLATAVTRIRWGLAHAGTAMVATAVVMALVGASAGLVDGRRTGDVAGSVGRLVAASLVTLPAIWVCIAIAVAFVGLVPRFTGLVWAVLIAFLLLGEFATIFGLPDWTTNLSPFGHVPALPGGTFHATPVVALLVIAAAVLAIGLAGLRRRDLPA